MYFKLILQSLHQDYNTYSMTKIDKNREIPKFLLDKRYLLGSVAFVFTFSILFMAVYSPFSMTAWFNLEESGNLGISLFLSNFVIVICCNVTAKIAK